MVAQLDPAGAVTHLSTLEAEPYSVLHSIQLHVERSAKAGTLFAIASSPHHYESIVALPLAFDGATVKIVVCSWPYDTLQICTSTAVLSLSILEMLKPLNFSARPGP